LKVTLSNRNFFSLFMAGLFAFIAMGVQWNFDAYMNNFFWGLTSSDIRWITLLMFVSASMGPILTPIITRRYDKKASALGIYAVSIIYSPMLVLLRLFGWFPANESPYLLPIIMSHAVTAAVLLVMFGIIQSSMLADIVEESQMKTGRREEGLFFAARTFAQKATSGVGAFIAGITLDLIQFPIGATPDQVSDEVLFRLGVISGPTMMVFYTMALIALSFYQITRTSHDNRIEILRERSGN
jgi:Na+/melibiose symporter-like transporter